MNRVILFSTLFAFICIGGTAQASEPPRQRTNLALGKKVFFSPAPNYWVTAKGDTDSTDLTDGHISDRDRMWSDASAVGWTYPGRFNVGLDLGQQSSIDEIAIHLQNGGTVGTGIMFPGWVEAFVSSDGKHYTKVAEFSRWHKDAFEDFGITQVKARGNASTDTLRFTKLKMQGRFVGLRIYGSTITVSDEVLVFGSPDANAAKQVSGTPSGFSVIEPQVYFNKPYLEVATNITLPVPIGLATPDEAGSDLTLTLDLPPGLTMPAGKIGGIGVTTVTPKVLSDGWNQYTFSAKSAKSNKQFGQVYMQSSGWKDGQKGELRYHFRSANWQSPLLSIPVRAVTVPSAPRLNKIMASLGWWYSASGEWPDQLNSFKTVGINTFNVFGKLGMPTDLKAPQWARLEKARREGFLISVIDSPVLWMRANHKDEKEIYNQLADGTAGKQLCICYRGKYYLEEVQRFATAMGRIQPDFVSADIELWSGGPKESRQCTRCQADFKASGLASWEAWQAEKGKEMIGDLTLAARKAVKDAGGREFKNGMYNLRPGVTYQGVFAFNSLNPQVLENSQVSTYTSLQADDLEYIGDEVRKDRAQLPHSDVMPWITPGDAGTFSGDDFQWALLECYTNGSSGIWFWSSRMWDSEDLIAYNKVIRAIAPVEDVIVRGDLVGAAAKIEGAGRVSGMKLGSRMLLLTADYFGKSHGTLKVKLNLPAKSSLRDLLTGDDVANELPAGSQTVSVSLNGQRARLLEVVPH